MLAAAVALGLAAVSALAQTDYLRRTITLIVLFAAAPTDVVARIVGEHMSRTLGQQIIVENVPGPGHDRFDPHHARHPTARPPSWATRTCAASVALYPNLGAPDVDFEPIGLVAERRC
jgi:hypothetical protein